MATQYTRMTRNCRVMDAILLQLHEDTRSVKLTEEGQVRHSVVDQRCEGKVQERTSAATSHISHSACSASNGCKNRAYTATQMPHLLAHGHGPCEQDVNQITRVRGQSCKLQYPACTGVAVLIYDLSVWIKDVKIKYKKGQA